MKSYMGFDWGTTRIGVAVGQALTGTAQPLQPIKANDGVPNWDNIEKVLNEWKPDAVIVGLPLNMDGTENDHCARAIKFANRIHGRFGIAIHMMDERLTSYESKGEVMRQGGNRNFKENSVDGMAAKLILESWMGSEDRG